MPQYDRKLMVSGKLELISASGPVGDWLLLDGRWFRTLDDFAFGYLANQIESAKRSGMPADAIEWAIITLDWIRDTGRFWGQLGASTELPPIPDSVGWYDGCPRWAESIDF